MFWKLLERLSDILRAIGAACLMGMTFLTCADVIGRFFRHPIFGSVELVSFMATLAVAMALPYTHKVRGHIGVELIVRNFSEKTQHLIDLVTTCLSFLLFCLVTWRMLLYGRTMQESGEVSMNLELPEHAIIYVVAFCFLVFVLVILEDISRLVKALRETS